MSWDQCFFDPIELPSGKNLVTLRDAALYITMLPKAEHDAEEWQAAMEALLLVAEHDGPTMLARIGVMRALNRHVERVFDPSRKDKHWGRRKPARDAVVNCRRSAIWKVAASKKCGLNNHARRLHPREVRKWFRPITSDKSCWHRWTAPPLMGE